MTADAEKEAKRIVRRNLLKGAVAGAAVAAVTTAGIEELRILEMVPQVVPELKATFAASPATVDQGGSVTFSVTASGGTPPYTVSIDCGDGSTLSGAGPHTYSSAGRYVALLTVTDSAVRKAYGTVSILVNAPPPPLTFEKAVTLNVNGTDYQLVVDNRLSLRDAIRDKLGLTGTKNGCDGMGECGACTVLADGKPILSCLMLAVEAQGMKIVTVEGLANPVTGDLDVVQKAFWENDGFQCGYCTPGMMMLVKGFLAEVPKPTQAQVKEALAGNLCRCGAHAHIVNSVMAASGGGP